MLVSVGISWLNQADFSPKDQSLDFTCSQETTPQISIFVGSLHSEDSWFHSKFTGKSLDTKCWHKGYQCCHRCYRHSQSPCDATGDYSPAGLAAPGAQGRRGGERQVVTTQSSPSESLEVKWQCPKPAIYLYSTKRKTHSKNLSRRNPVVVDWPFFLPTNIYPGLSHDWSTFVIH